MIRQCLIIFGCWALGELLVFITQLAIPSSIVGMLLLTLFLQMGWIKEKWVKGFSDLLTNNLPLFFVPPGVGLLLYFDLIKASFWPIIIAALGSTVIVLAVTGWVHQTLRNRKL